MKKNNSISLLLLAVVIASCNSAPDDFVKVEGGTFMKGWTEKERELISYVDTSILAPKEMSVETFYISKYEVTTEQWYEVMGYLPRNIAFEKWARIPAYPVMGITWFEAVKFCNKLSQKEGYKGCYDFGKIDVYGRFAKVTMKPDAEGYRLPTDVEWEYAARGGKKSKGYRFAGSDSLSEVAHWNKREPSMVGCKKPNELGIYDMTGNVAEFTYGIDAHVTSGQSFVTTQGGSFDNRGRGGKQPKHYVIYRYGTSWGDNYDTGMRLVFQKKK